MEQVSIIGLAKRSFSLHGARADGSVAFRRTLGRPKVLDFLKRQPKCIVEACGSSHYWGREKLGHEVRLLPPVKPFVKRQKNDTGGRRSRTDVVAVKTEEQQGMMWHARSLFVRQRTQTALRGRGVRSRGSPRHRQRQEARRCVAGIACPTWYTAADLLERQSEKEDRRAKGRLRRRTRSGAFPGSVP